MEAEIGRVYVECGVDIIYVEKLVLKQEMNKHARVMVKAFLSENAGKNAVTSITSGTNVRVTYVIKDKTEERNILLFEGMPTKVNVTCENGIYTMELAAVSATYQLDIQKKSRSFQDISKTYRDIMKQIIIQENSGQCIFSGKVDEEIGIPYIQYEETDWQFLKRLASRINSFLIPNMSNGKMQIYVGVPTRPTKELKDDRYEKVRDVWEHNTYIVWSKSEHQLCDMVSFAGDIYSIWKKEANFHDEVLWFCYELRKKENWEQYPEWNEKLAGATLEGKVLEVEGNRMRLHLSIDEKQEKGKAYWYPYATEYSSSNQVGGYHMPEVGEQVLLRIPSCKEELAYIATVKRSDGAGNSKTSDHQTRYFESADGKTIQLSQDTLSLTPTEGISITLTDSGGIDITSSSKVEIEADKEIALSGKTITLDGADEIELATSGGTINQKDKIDIYSPSGVRQIVC